MKKVINKLEIYFSMDPCDCSGFFWGLLFSPRGSFFEVNGQSYTENNTKWHLLPENGQMQYNKGMIRK